MGGERENKVWIEKDGIIYVEVVKTINEKELLDLLERVKEVSKEPSTSRKLLIVNLVTSSVLRSYRFRKKVGEKFREIIFEKGAICEESFFSRIVASFIIAASGIKNVRIFETKKKALKWLKKANF